jgi:surface protein
MTLITDANFHQAITAYFESDDHVTYGNIDNWDVSNVTNMRGTFTGRISTDYTGIDLSNWDTSNVTDMTIMFYKAQFTSDLSNWDVGKVTSMASMFRETALFNSDLSQWKTSNVTTMGSMFQNTSAFTGDPGGTNPIYNWDTSNVTSMWAMFYQASSFNADISDWKVSNVTRTAFMFEGAIAFNQNLVNWDVSKVTTMANMFKGAIAFNQNLVNWDVSNVTNMVHMFEGAITFNQNLSGWNVCATYDLTRAVIDDPARYLFSGATAFLPNILTFWPLVCEGVQTAGGVGDPYIYPVVGPAYKLPNTPECYRLYEDARVVINARVSPASETICREIDRFTAGTGLKPVTYDAYFFSQLYIARRDGTDSVELDLEKRSTTGATGTTGTFFQTGSLVVNADTTSPIGQMLETHVSLSIHWEQMHLCVSFSRNPQVRNGVSLHGRGITAGTGLLVRNYRPKLFRLARLDDRSDTCTRRLQKCARQTTRRGVAGYREHQMTITV